MYTFSELIKQIRKEAGLTQATFAKRIGVSKVLVTMIETNQKEVSKKFLQKLARSLDVHPASITPLSYQDYEYFQNNKISPIEERIISLGEKMQKHLIKNRSKHLKKNEK